MQKILIAFILLSSTICFANDIAKQFSEGFQGIHWQDSSTNAKAYLQKKGVEFKESTSDYSPDTLYISFTEGDIKTQLTFYKNMFASFIRTYELVDPDDDSTAYWNKILSPATENLSVDNERIRAYFSVPSSSNISVGDWVKTSVDFSLNVYFRPMEELRNADQKRRAELKKQHERAMVADIAQKLINPNQGMDLTR